MSNKYDKMEDYVISVFNVFQMVNRKGEQQNDRRLKGIGYTIYNYSLYLSRLYNINLKDILEPESINLIPIFEYIAANDIELYDFSNMNINDFDANKKEHLERYILTHIYYITQNK